MWAGQTQPGRRAGTAQSDHPGAQPPRPAQGGSRSARPGATTLGRGRRRGIPEIFVHRSEWVFPPHGCGPCPARRSRLSPQLPLPGVLTRGPQLHARPLGEAVEAHAIEHVESCAQLIACLSSPALAAQPLAIEEVGTGELGSGSGPAEQGSASSYCCRASAGAASRARERASSPRARGVPVEVARSSKRWSARSARSRRPARTAASTRSGSAWVPTSGVSSVYAGCRHPTAEP